MDFRRKRAELRERYKRKEPKDKYTPTPPTYYDPHTKDNVDLNRPADTYDDINEIGRVILQLHENHHDARNLEARKQAIGIQIDHLQHRKRVLQQLDAGAKEGLDWDTDVSTLDDLELVRAEHKKWILYLRDNSSRMCEEVRDQYSKRASEYSRRGGVLRLEQIQKARNNKRKDKRKRKENKVPADVTPNKQKKKKRMSQKQRKRKHKSQSESEGETLNLTYDSNDGKEGSIPIDFEKEGSGSSSPSYSPTSPHYSPSGSDTDSRASNTSPEDTSLESNPVRRQNKRSRHRTRHTDPSPQEANSADSESDDVPPDYLPEENNQEDPQVSCNNQTHLTRRSNTNITPAEVAAYKPKDREPIRTDKPIRRGHFIMNFLRMC